MGARRTPASSSSLLVLSLEDLAPLPNEHMCACGASTRTPVLNPRLRALEECAKKELDSLRHNSEGACLDSTCADKRVQTNRRLVRSVTQR